MLVRVMLKRSLVFGFALITLAGCRDGNRQVEVSDTTTVTRTETPNDVITGEKPRDTVGTATDTSRVVTAPLTPVDPVEPDRAGRADFGGL